MAIKLKRFLNYKIYVTVFILTVLLFTGTTFTFINEIKKLNFDSYELLRQENYTESNAFLRNKDQLRSNISSLVLYYKSEEFIISGGTVTKERLAEEKENLFWEKRSALHTFLLRQNNTYETSINDSALWAAFETEYAAEIDNLATRVINKDLAEYRSLLAHINQKEEFYYAVHGPDDYLLTNAPDNSESFFQSFTHHYEYIIEDNANYIDSHSYPLYLAYQEDFIAASNAQWVAEKRQLEQTLLQLSALILLLLLGLGYLIWATGQKDPTDPDNDTKSFADRIYTEFVAGSICCFSLAIILVMAAWYQTHNYLFGGLMVIFTALTLAALLILLKHLKNRDFLKYTLTWVLAGKLAAAIKSIYYGGPLIHKTVLMVLVFGILTMTSILGFITVPIALWLTYKLVGQFEQILKGTEKIKSGRYHTKIDIPDQGELGQLADNLNQIAAGLNSEVENRMKSERLKTELISNVSHDIRTPLTSVITYVDLLKKEPQASEKASGYLEIIDQKSARLKTLIDDLFEASKLNSNNVPVKLEKVDLADLLKQGLGEIDDRIHQSGLDFKLNIPPEKIFVQADGKMLWRVIENLLSNVFKYSLPQSRVYIDLQQQEQQVELNIKNISAYELNIEPDELMERFKRGDESRHSEGSGLGLNIAKALMTNQNGDLKLKIDGDLFKATITMLKHDAP